MNTVILQLVAFGIIKNGRMQRATKERLKSMEVQCDFVSERLILLSEAIFLDYKVAEHRQGSSLK